MTSFGRAAAIVTAALLATFGVAAPARASAETDWRSFPGGIAPGTTIAQIQENGDYRTCTLGLIAGDPATHHLFGITAGHCDKTTNSRPTVYYTDADTPAVARPLGSYTVSRSDDGSTPTGDPNVLPTYTDAGVIAIKDGTPISSFKIAGQYPMRAVVEDYHDLPAGTEVCKFGMRTGETCGPVVVAAKYTITARLNAIHGDSGSPLYVKNDDGSVDLIGLASTDDGDTAKFFWVGPVLRALNLQVCGCGAN